MGQKVNPIGLRVSVNKDWRSRWYGSKKDFGDLLHEDLRMRKLLDERLREAAVAKVEIERYANRARVTVHTARPGIVIGRKGQDIERLRSELAEMTGKEIYIEIQEIKNPDSNAKLVADNIAMQLRRRVSFRRAMKRAVSMAMESGAEGVRIEACGRLGGSELARRESYKSGKVPLHTLRADVDYGFSESRTTAGTIGVKVWICNQSEPDVMKEKSHAAHA